MITKYIINSIFEHEINAINQELSVCIDYLCNCESDDTKDAQFIVDKLSFAAQILNRMQDEINKL